MQALEKIGVLEQDEEKGGRRITQSGQRDLDRKFLRGFSGRIFLHVSVFLKSKRNGGKAENRWWELELRGYSKGWIQSWLLLPDKERIG